MKMLNALALSVALASPVLLAGCGKQPEPTSTEKSAPAPTASAPSPQPGTLAAGDWPNFGGDGHEQHYSPFDEISLATVDRLKLA